jgi:hypothetical protein
MGVGTISAALVLFFLERGMSYPSLDNRVIEEIIAVNSVKLGSSFHQA